MHKKSNGNTGIALTILYNENLKITHKLIAIINYCFPWFKFSRIDFRSIEGECLLSHLFRKMAIYTDFDFDFKVMNFPVNDLQRID